METSTTNKQQILSKYMEYILDHGEKPKSIYAFTKQLNIEEQLFYNYYSSFDELAQDVYTTFYNETIKLITKDKSFDELDPKNKLLLFYFTFFELLTANRSYVLLTLKESKNVLEKIKNLQPLKQNLKTLLKVWILKKLILNKTILIN